LLEPNIDADANRNRTRSCQPFGNAREQGLECAQATTEETVNVSALRRSRTRLGARGKPIAFKHGHPYEVRCQGGRRGKAADSGTHDDCMIRMWFDRH
jgi:hypothetical protein